MLESLGAFRGDSLSNDGTDVPVPIKHNQSPHRYHFGAKSDKKKFHGFWLMIACSVRHQIARSFEVGYAREGQITVCKGMLYYRRIDDSKENYYSFLLIFIYTQRTSSERVNGHSKTYTLISRIANKVKKEKTILKSTVEHIVTFTFILEQLKLLTEYKDKLRQKTLRDFFRQH